MTGAGPAWPVPAWGLDLGTAGLAGLNFADYGILAVVGCSAVYGLLRGLLREVFSLALWVGGAWAAMRYSHLAAARLEHAIPLEQARPVAAFALTYLGVLVAGGMAASLLGRLLSGAGLGFADRLGGLLFGLARGGVVVAVLVMLAGSTALPREAWWRQARLIPPFQSLAAWLRDQVPNSLPVPAKIPEAIVKR